jgi:hypothetical protein
MDSHRFDTLAKLLAGRRSRRAALSDGAAGQAGLAALGTAPARRATAQDAAQPAAVADPALLFVQVFDAGELAPKAGEVGVYTLTFSGGTGTTLYFSDRPDRLVGTLPTAAFLDRLGFSPEDPPNAALVAAGPDGEAVYVVELLDPILDEGADTLTYDVVLLGEADVELRFRSGVQAAPTEALTFGASHLFVDDATCGKHEVLCYTSHDDTSVGSLGAGFGFRVNLLYWVCRPSEGCPALRDRCSAAFPACAGGACYAAPSDCAHDACPSCYWNDTGASTHCNSSTLHFCN